MDRISKREIALYAFGAIMLVLLALPNAHKFRATPPATPSASAWEMFWTLRDSNNITIVPFAMNIEAKQITSVSTNGDWVVILVQRKEHK